MTVAGPVAGRPLPLIDADNAPFFEAAARGVLLIQQCVDTGRCQYYPRPRSLFTGGEVRWIDVAGTGKIYSFSTVRQNYGATGFQALTPYVVALIDLTEGVRMIGNVIDCAPEDVTIDMAVEVRFIRVDAERNLHLPFWRPAR